MPCTQDPVYRDLKNQGPAAGGGEPVGGDLGESIPKGLEAGLRGALGELPCEVKPRRLVRRIVRYAHYTAAAFAEARWQDLTGGCAPETGHLADSMPEAEAEEQGSQLNQYTCSLICKTSDMIQKTSQNRAGMTPSWRPVGAPKWLPGNLLEPLGHLKASGLVFGPHFGSRFGLLFEPNSTKSRSQLLYFDS